MEKVIYINLGGRVLAIEEPAAKKLEKYIENLLNHFKNEEGCDEIISDIEARMADHFKEKLDKGKACLQAADVEEIIALIGKPEDFDEAASENNGEGNFNRKDTSDKKRLYRNKQDIIIGGVCSGIATYFNIDPVIIRLIFALITLGGFGFGIVIYFILWIVLPVNANHESKKTRIFRNTEERILGGVCSGIAAYFGISPIIPRLVFLLPFIASIFFFPFGMIAPVFYGSFGGTMLMVYIILWVVIPKAKTRADKMEMHGEDVNLENIMKSVKEDIKIIKEKTKEHNIEGKIEDIGKELESSLKKGAKRIEKESEAFSERLKARTKELNKELRNAGRAGSSSLSMFLRAIAIGIMVIFFFTFMVIFFLAMYASTSLYPLLTYFTFTASDQWLFYIALLGFPFLLFWSSGLGLLSLITGRNIALKVVGVISTFAWVALIISISVLAWKYSLNFRYNASQKTEVYTLENLPEGYQLKVRNIHSQVNSTTFNFENLFEMNADTLYFKLIEYKLHTSPDSVFRIVRETEAYGKTQEEAVDNTSGLVSISPELKDSVVYIPNYVLFTPGQKMHQRKITYHLYVPSHIETDFRFSNKQSGKMYLKF
jgi:phage shock protein PspC (stress-responsive transcriptional regulator)